MRFTILLPLSNETDSSTKTGVQYVGIKQSSRPDTGYDILNLIARIGPCSAATIIDTWGSLKARPICCLMNSGVSVS